MTHESARLEAGLWAVKEDRAGGRRERFQWAVRIRWLTIAGFLALGLGAWRAGVLLDPWPCAGAAMGAALCNGVNHLAVRRWQRVAAATLLAVVGDVVLITLLVVETGGMASPFLAMYSVQVLAAAMLVEVRLAVACAAAAVAAFAGGSAYSATSGAWIDVEAAHFLPVWTGFFALGLGLVAYVGGHVSRQLRQREQALEGANRELAAALVSVRQGNVALRATVERLASTERQLAQSEKMRALGDFVAAVAHELNNPIAIVAANLQLLGDELTAAGAPRRCGGLDAILRDCGEAAARAARIVGDLRQFARAGGERERRLIDLDRCIARTVELARHLFGAGVAIEIDLRAGAGVCGIAAELDQVLLNLLGNAAQAVAGSGTVRVATDVVGAGDARRFRLRVLDDGPGVPDEIAARVFEPFFTTRPEGQGVGLGLSLSFAIVERHGGTLRVAPNTPHGACFEVLLPAEKTPVADAAGPCTAANPPPPRGSS